MRLLVVRAHLLVIALAPLMLGSGCIDGKQLQTSVTSGIASVITDVIAAVVETAVIGPITGA